MNDANIIRLQHFFQVDIAIKKGIYNIAPLNIQYTDNDSINKYTNDLNDILEYIFCELKCISIDIFGKESSVFSKICNLEKIIKEQFYSCEFDIDKLIIFYKNYLSNLEKDFINSVHNECVGYTMGGTKTIEKAKSINEVLHFIHSYVVNNDQILQIIPLINTKINNYQYPIRLRGFNTPIFEQLFNQFPIDLDVGWTDMVIINEKKLIMMVRDREHALTIEISLNNDIARLEYFIPKLCNIEMINKLPGINKVNKNSIGATGIIEVPINELSRELFNFISMVPTDADMVFENAI